MVVLVKVFGAFCLISESKTGTMWMLIPRAPATEICLRRHGEQYRQTTSFNYSGGTVSETLDMLDKMDLRIRKEWIRFRRYTRKRFDRPKASLLRLKGRMVKSKVVEALLRGYVTWTPL